MTERLTVRRVIAAVSAVTGIERKLLVGDARSAKLVEARAAIASLAREAGYSLPHIGRELGNRDHTTILHALRGVSGDWRGDRIARVREIICTARELLLFGASDTPLASPPDAPDAARADTAPATAPAAGCPRGSRRSQNKGHRLPPFDAGVPACRRVGARRTATSIATASSS